MANPYVGEIRVFGFHFAPTDWAFCNGQLMNISQNQALFSILGTTFGGNGTTNFALPNFQNTAPMHWGSGPGLSPCQLGEAQGTPSVTLNVTQMSPHSHMIQSAQGTGAQLGGIPGPTVWLGNSQPGQAYLAASGALDSPFSPKAISINGGSTPHDNIQPLLTLNFCICLFGVFPSRN